MRRISYEQALSELKNQGVEPRDYAFVCPICKTVQSMNSLVRAGAQKDRVDRFIGFSCEGRLSKVGPWPSDKDQSAAAVERRKQRGCNWTLGGLFQLHELIVFKDDQTEHPHFEIATKEQAQLLAREFAEGCGISHANGGA